MTANPKRGGWTLDIVAIAVVAIGTVAVTSSAASGLLGSPLHVALGLLFTFLIPGAALTAALFPAQKREVPASKLEFKRVLELDGSVTSMERFVLSVGLSVMVVPLIGLLLNFSPVGVRLFTVIPAIAGFSLVFGAIGLLRRFRLPPEERYRISLIVPFERVIQWIRAPTAKRDRILNLMLAVGLLVAATGIGYAVIAPQPGERFTEFYLRTGDPETGELVADDYPSEVEEGERLTLYLGLTNQEHRTVSYTVVVKLQQVYDRETPFISTTEVDRFSTTVDHGESWQREHIFTPTITGENMRLTYLLYKGEPPENPTRDNSYRSVHIWLDIG
jgi:uncharacterized membrane protein